MRALVESDDDDVGIGIAEHVRPGRKDIGRKAWPLLESPVGIAVDLELVEHQLSCLVMFELVRLHHVSLAVRDVEAVGQDRAREVPEAPGRDLRVVGRHRLLPASRTSVSIDSAMPGSRRRMQPATQYRHKKCTRYSRH